MDALTVIFDRFAKLFEAGSGFALLAAFFWGILSIILSPCHLSGIPLAIGFINGKGKLKTSRAFFLSSIFALGILITIAAVGLITGLLGRMLGDVGSVGIIIVAVLLVLVGVLLLDVIPLPQFLTINPNMKAKGGMGALLLGLLFGLALGPCSFGFMMPLLIVVFKSAQTNILYSIMLLALFALGHIGVIVLAGTFINWVQRYLNWTEKSRGVMVLRKICGILVILTGIYLIVGQIK